MERTETEWWSGELRSFADEECPSTDDKEEIIDSRHMSLSEYFDPNTIVVKEEIKMNFENNEEANPSVIVVKEELEKDEATEAGNVNNQSGGGGYNNNECPQQQGLGGPTHNLCIPAYMNVTTHAHRNSVPIHQNKQLYTEKNEIADKPTHSIKLQVGQEKSEEATDTNSSAAPTTEIINFTSRLELLTYLMSRTAKHFCMELPSFKASNIMFVVKDKLPGLSKYCGPWKSVFSTQYKEMFHTYKINTYRYTHVDAPSYRRIIHKLNNGKSLYIFQGQYPSTTKYKRLTKKDAAELLLNNKECKNAAPSVLSNCHFIINGRNYPPSKCKWVKTNFSSKKLEVSEICGIVHVKCARKSEIETDGTNIVTVCEKFQHSKCFPDYSRATFRIGGRSIVQYIGTEPSALCGCSKEIEEPLKEEIKEN